MITPSETHVELTREGIAFLWRIRGSNAHFYPNKWCAEMAARSLFPNESAEERYSRLSYVRFQIED